MSQIEGSRAKLSRRTVVAGAGLATAQLVLGMSSGAEAGQSTNKEFPLYDAATVSVIPSGGYDSRIALKGCVVKLVRHGVISRDKFRDLQKYNGPMPDELSGVLMSPSNSPIHLTKENANHYVNLLWAAGLSNHLEANKESPIAGPDLPRFASPGGWNLGKAREGSVYFNKFSIIALSAEAEALAVRVAKATYRPCCNNSTFFQDCNHGSALFAVLQLGARRV